MTLWKHDVTETLHLIAAYCKLLPTPLSCLNTQTGVYRFWQVVSWTLDTAQGTLVGMGCLHIAYVVGTIWDVQLFQKFEDILVLFPVCQPWVGTVSNQLEREPKGCEQSSNALHLRLTLVTRACVFLSCSSGGYHPGFRL